MATPRAPAYGPLGYSNLDEEATAYRSPAPFSQPFPHYAPDDADISAAYELHDRRPDTLKHKQSENTVYSGTLFPSPNNKSSQSDEDPFLRDHFHSANTFHTANAFVPYKDNTARQLRHILIASSARWLITATLCGAYILATRIWQNKGAQSEGQKKTYNTITTGISIALGLNIASAFKDMALNMRWPILAGRTRNLVELDLILNADSLTKLAKLAFIAPRPMVIFACVFWLLANILAQAGIAMLSLTYSFDTDRTTVQMARGNVSIPNMSHFFPQAGAPNSNPSIQDEEYAAHMYGEYGYQFSVNESIYMPKSGAIYQPRGAMIWSDVANKKMSFVFSDSPKGEKLGEFSVYTSRTIDIKYSCDSHKVTANGTGTSDFLVVEDIGQVILPQTVPRSLTYFTNASHTCDGSQRCSVVQAFESSDTDPWYYRCNITLGRTESDPYNISFVSDYMARIATASIAQVGYTDYRGVASQIYPQDCPWGIPLRGNTTAMGKTMATFGLGSIAGATIYNPYVSYFGDAPQAGVYLHVGHPKFFYLIICLIAGCHLTFIIVVAILTNRVVVGPDGHLSMSLLMRPIADALHGISNGKENKPFRDAKRNTLIIYEKDPMRGKWSLNMVKR